jgi:hypothetical protein
LGAHSGSAVLVCQCTTGQLWRREAARHVIDSLHLGAGLPASKENLKNGFLVLDISGSLLRAREGLGLSSVPGGSAAISARRPFP